MFCLFDLFITDRSINNGFPFRAMTLGNGYARYANERCEQWVVGGCALPTRT